MFFLVGLTCVVASTAIRIEWYNHAVGGFLPRPQPPSMEGNDVKWRMWSPMLNEMRLRESVAIEQGVVLSEDFESRKNEVFDIELTLEQQLKVDEFARRAELNNAFRNLVSSMGLVQYPLVALGLFLSSLTLKIRHRPLRLVGGACLALHVVAGSLMLYRGYFSSLGW